MVPIQVTNLSNEYVVVEMSSKKIGVKIKGSKEDLKNISRKSVTVEADLRSPVVGKPSKYPVVLNVLEQYENVTYELSDKKVLMLVEKKFSKRVPVRLVTSGNVDDNWLHVGSTLKPDVVTITGPESMLSSIDYINTETLDLEQEKGSFKRNISLSIKKKDVLSVIPATVEVNISELPSFEVEKFELPLKTSGELTSNEYHLMDKTVNVFFKGKLVKKDDVVALVDFSSFDPKSDAAFNETGEILKEFKIKLIYDRRKENLFLSTMPNCVMVKIKRK